MLNVPVPVNIVWIGPDQTTVISTTNSAMKSLTLYTSSFTLNSVESLDSGNYTCAVNTVGGRLDLNTTVSARINIMIGK